MMPPGFDCPDCGLTGEDGPQEEEEERALEHVGQTLDVSDAAAPADRAERRPTATQAERR